jgi:cytochrome c
MTRFSKGTGAGAAVAAALAVLVATTAGPVAASEALAGQKLCLNCHKIADKQVGPPFKAVAARYANDKGAVEALAERIQKGSVPMRGNWGAVPMPANPQVSPAEAKQLAAWVLSLK